MRVEWIAGWPIGFLGGPPKERMPRLLQDSFVDWGTCSILSLCAFISYCTVVATQFFLPFPWMVLYSWIWRKVLMMVHHLLTLLKISYPIWNHGQYDRVFLWWIIVLSIMLMMSHLCVLPSEFDSQLHLLVYSYCYYSGIWLYYLPPYSPDLNAIDKSFAYVKSVLHHNGDDLWTAVDSKNPQSVFYTLHSILASITLEMVMGWMGHSGYISVDQWAFSLLL